MPLPARAKPPTRKSAPPSKPKAKAPARPPRKPSTPPAPPIGGGGMLPAPTGMEMPGTTPRMPSPRMVPAASAFSVNAPPLNRPGAPLGIGQEQGAGHMSNYRQPLGRGGVGAGQPGPQDMSLPANARPPGMPMPWQGGASPSLGQPMPMRPGMGGPGLGQPMPYRRPPMGPTATPQVGMNLGQTLQSQAGTQRSPAPAQAPQLRQQGMGNDKPKPKTGAGQASKGRVGAGRDLSTAARNKLPSSSFALPGKGTGASGKGAGSYPIPDRTHGQNALARVAQHGTPAEKATVRAKVKAKFGMGNQGKKK